MSARLAMFVVATALTASTAGAVTDSNFTYDAFKLGSFPIHGYALAPFASVSGGFGWEKDGSAGTVIGTGGYGCLSTSVDLPNGAWLYALDIVYANAAGDNVYVEINRGNGTDSGAYVVSQNVPENSGTRKSLRILITNSNLRLVNNDAYYYGFAVCLGASDKFYGARLYYHYNSAGD